jgi:RNA polymerase sigma factor (sigma-70 family)
LAATHDEVNAQSDPQLLRAYVERRSEAAFAELVRRHIDLVHSAAFRMVNDPHLAKDVTQGVFVALAKDAGKLTDHPVLSGWLHRTARNIAANTIRSEVRRRTREKEAAAMNEFPETEAPWEEIAPHLDAALAELSEPDRDAVLLRYFENKPAQEMATILGISAEAAQKRVSRAVERLRENFAKRGVPVGSTGLAGVISVNAVQAAPAGLAAASLSAVFAGEAGVFLATKALAITAIQKAIVGATVVALIAGATIYQTQRRNPESVSALTPPIANERATKSHRRVQTPTTTAVSERNKERIRATLRSAHKSADPSQRDDTAVRELEDLLRSRPGDLAFVHELAVEARRFPQATQEALATAVVRRYQDGDFQRLGELIDALGTEGVMRGIQVNFFANELARHEDQNLAVRAFEELLARPSKVIHPDHYQNIASGAARPLGHPEALARIPDIQDGWFGTAAADDLISGWVYGDPVAASTFVRDLPASPFRDNLIIHLVEQVAESEDFEMANEWVNSLQGKAKEKALAIIKQRQDILREQEEQRAQLPDQEED